jgi:hypothetical protein
MKQAFFITGFNNWGKTTIIQDLFNRKRFYYNQTYEMEIMDLDIRFTVQSQSNDDLWGQDWADTVLHRISLSPDKGFNLLSALCPSIELTNNFVDLLNGRFFRTYERLNFFLLENKWDHHAKLMTDNIILSAQSLRNANFIVINSDNGLTDDTARYNAKIRQIQEELERLF